MHTWLRRHLAIVGGYAALLLAVFHMVWRGRMFFGWDCLREYWPDLVYGARALAAGELPLWNPFALGGYSFHGDPQAGLFAPLQWLLYAAAWIGGYGPWLVQAKVLLTMLVGLTGMHYLVLRRERSHAAAFVAAVVFVLGGPLLVHKAGALLWPILYLPWALLALDRFLAAPSPWRGALLAVAVWLCGTAGHPQSFFYDLVVVFAYWGYRLAVEPGRARAQWRGALVFAGLAALLLLPLYLPAAQAVAASPRAHRGLAYVLQGSLAPRRLDELLLPNLDADWMSDIYLGPLALVGAVVAVAAAAGRRARGEQLFWVGMALFALLLALGANTPVLPFLARRVPGFGLFRIAYRHKIVFAFAAALLAGAGVGAIARREGPPWLRWLVAGLGAAWVAGAAVTRLVMKDAAPAHAVTLALATAGPALALLAAAAHCRSPARARWLLAGAAGLACADLWAAAQPKIAIMQPPPVLARDRAVLGKLDGVASGGRDWRYWNDGVLPHHVPYLHDVRELSGFSNPVVVARQEDLVARVARTPAILRHFNVRFWLSRRPAAGLVGVRPVAPGIFAVDDAVPLLRLYPRAELVPAARTLDRLAAPGPLAAALVDPADRPPALPASDFAPVDGQVTRYRRNRIDLDVDAPAAGIAVLSENFYAGWRATIDGRPARIFRANYLLRAVVMPAGRHRLSFVYAPPGGGVLRIGFLAALAIVVGLGIHAARRARRAADAA